MTTPSDPRQGGQPGGQQAQRGPGAPGGYGPPPGYGQQYPGQRQHPGHGQQPGGHGAGWPGQQVSQGPPPSGGQPGGYPPPPAGYGPPPGYGPAPGHAAGPQVHQQPSGYPAPSPHPDPSGAPGPIPQWWERFVGRFIDNLLFGVVSLVLSSIVGAAFTPSAAEILSNGFRLGYGYYLAMAITSLITGALFAGYDVLMHSRNGQTLGKMALKTRVVTPDGGRPDQASLIRRAAVYPVGGIVLSALLMLVPGIALTGLSSLILIGYAVAMSVPILTDSLGRGLHDKWAGTIVVKA